MKKLIVLLALTLSGCAGLNVTWQLQADYISKELATQRKAEAAQLRAEQAAPK